MLLDFFRDFEFVVTSLPDVCKCVLLTFFLFIACYSLSLLSPNLKSLVVFFYRNYLWLLLQSDILFLAIRLTCLTLLLISLNDLCLAP